MTGLTWLFGFWGFFFLLGLFESILSEHTVKSDKITRWPVNIGLGVVNGVLASLLPIGTVLVASWAATNSFGLLHMIELPFLIAIVATVLIRSLMQYLFHRLVHKFPVLWSIHRVHHCDYQLDGSTGLRFHPLEVLAVITFITPVVMLMGLDPATLIVFEAFEIIVGIVSHTSIKLPTSIEWYLRTIFITPGLHRLHHSDFELETENNFGSVFSFWDRLFGTYLAGPVAPPHQFRIGIKGVEPRQASNFSWLLLSPWIGPRIKPRRKVKSVKNRND